MTKSVVRLTILIGLLIGIAFFPPIERATTINLTPQEALDESVMLISSPPAAISVSGECAPPTLAPAQGPVQLVSTSSFSLERIEHSLNVQPNNWVISLPDGDCTWIIILRDGEDSIFLIVDEEEQKRTVQEIQLSDQLVLHEFTVYESALPMLTNISLTTQTWGLTFSPLRIFLSILFLLLVSKEVTSLRRSAPAKGGESKE